MEIKQRDYAKYPNPSDEPMEEQFARLGLRLKEPGEDVISWGQNAFVTSPQAPSSSPTTSEGESKPSSLVEWSKTPEFKDGWMKRLEANEAKPPIYSAGYVEPEK